MSLEIYDREVTAFIGSSGCGKSTLLRCLNRTNDLIPGTKLTGRITLDGLNIYDRRNDVCDVQKRFGWVAQKPNPFAKSVYENIAFGARIKGLIYGRQDTDAVVYAALQQAGLWNEVKDRLHDYHTLHHS